MDGGSSAWFQQFPLSMDALAERAPESAVMLWYAAPAGPPFAFAERSGTERGGRSYDRLDSWDSFSLARSSLP